MSGPGLCISSGISARRGGNQSVPESISAVIGWLRVAQATVTGSGVSSLPNVLGGSPATQSTDAARPGLGSSGNGLPILQFTGTQFLVHPLQSNVNNNSAFFGMGLWLRSAPTTTARSIYAVRSAAGGASAHRMMWQINSDETVLADFNLDNSNARRIRTNAAQAAGGWEFWTLEHQGSLSGDARCLQRKDGAQPASTYSAVGTATEMPATLVTPTGNAFIGSTTTTPTAPMIGDFGPNIFFFNRQLTAGELTALMAFEQPVG